MAENTTLPRLTPRVHQVLDYAQDEAQRRGHSGVDTEHLLLGLLREPCSTGVSILERLPVSAKKIHQELLTQMGPCRKRPGHRPTTWLPLTERAHQVLALASHEAHRFDTRYVATEHLLLGLLLAGKGKAASVLFGEGVTVAGIHAEIIKSKNAPSQRAELEPIFKPIFIHSLCRPPASTHILYTKTDTILPLHDRGGDHARFFVFSRDRGIFRDRNRLHLCV